MGLDTKIYWLTDRQSQCDFNFDFDYQDWLTDWPTVSRSVTSTLTFWKLLFRELGRVQEMAVKGDGKKCQELDVQRRLYA
jgi:hypothetical protein